MFSRMTVVIVKKNTFYLFVMEDANLILSGSKGSAVASSVRDAEFDSRSKYSDF